MNAEPCLYEEELLDSLGRGFVGSELVSHIETCPSCTELHTVAGALLDERVHAMTEAAVPSAGTMWWRLQVRARHDAAAAARRSLLLGQAATLVIALSLMGWVFGGDIAVGVRQVIATLRVSTPLMLVVATWLVLAPIAGYVAIRQK